MNLNKRSGKFKLMQYSVKYLHNSSKLIVLKSETIFILFKLNIIFSVFDNLFKNFEPIFSSSSSSFTNIPHLRNNIKSIEI